MGAAEGWAGESHLSLILLLLLLLLFLLQFLLSLILVLGLALAPLLLQGSVRSIDVLADKEMWEQLRDGLVGSPVNFLIWP
jgi:hypothetical protein